MPSVGDKYVLTLTAFYTSDAIRNNPVNNVFAYEATSGSPSSTGLWDAFNTHVVPFLPPLMHVSLVIQDATVVNLDDLTDFTNVTSIAEEGEWLGEALPPFMAFELEYVRATREAHNGRKSFAGLGESMLTGGVPETAVAADLLTLSGALSVSISETGFGAEYTPRIWRRAGRYAPYSGDPRVGTLYPDTFYPIAGVSYRRVSTQNSRKR